MNADAPLPDVPALPDSDDGWRQRLAHAHPMAYAVTRHGATEPPFTGSYWRHDEPGIYRCVCCHHPLFSSEDKFDAGCGWPSYVQELPGAGIKRLMDESHGMVRVELRCGRCDAHLGHVFDDGPLPTGERYCINSCALDFQGQ